MTHCPGFPSLFFLIAISSAEPAWRPVVCAVPQGSGLGPASFNIFTTDVDEELQWTLSQFPDHMGLKRVVDSPPGCAVIQ